LTPIRESSLRGTFDPAAVPVLHELRQGRLNRADWYDEPDFLVPVEASVQGLGDSGWREVLDRYGAVKITLDRSMLPAEFIAFGQGLGSLIPERAPAVQPFVQDGMILNLRTDLPETQDVDLQPFAENFITLHTEGSLSALDVQPRYLVFLCLSAPQPGGGGQTLVRPVRPLVDELPANVIDTLVHTTLAGTAGVPVFRWEGERLVLCFRDRGDTTIDWISTGDDPDTVNSALGLLLRAIYELPGLSGIHWMPASLVILDNTAVMHGRSQVRPGGGEDRRHIQRLRVRAA